MNKLSLYIIKFYQRYISPKKGYCCAYGSLYNDGSCSEIVSSIIKEKGLISGWSHIKNQFILCSEAYEIIKKENKDKVKKKKKDNDWCHPLDACDVFTCIPVPKSWCKGNPADSSCDLPCDCSF